MRVEFIDENGMEHWVADNGERWVQKPGEMIDPGKYIKWFWIVVLGLAVLAQLISLVAHLL